MVGKLLGSQQVLDLFVKKTVTRRKMCTSVLEIISSKPVGNTKTVKGWIKSVRKMKGVNFIDVTDGSCNAFLQIVSPKALYTEPLQWGASIDVTGTVQVTPKGQVELLAEKLNIVGKCDVTDNYPFVPVQKQSYDHYRQYLHLRPQIKYFSSMLRFRNAASTKIRQYFSENGFVEIHTPIITSSDCEGAGETFTLRPQSEKLLQDMKKENVSSENAFFDCPAFLTVSGQLHLEAITRSISKVYTFNPTFRAENSKSRLHLSEFYMIESEEAFISDLKSILTRIEDCIKQVTEFLLTKHIDEIEFMLQHNETDAVKHLKVLENLVHKPFSVMTFAEAKSIVEKNKNEIKSKTISQYSLSKAEELFLVENNENVPVFVVDWPKDEKPFYMKESDENHDLVKAVDLLVPNVGELCGGSLREDNYDALQKKLSDLHLTDSLQWYAELRKFGNVPTGGFGMGFERFLQFLLNIGNIKDTIPFPRWPHGLQL